MPASFSTANRMFFLTLQEYGEDDLLIEEMTGDEAVSRLFEFRLRLLSWRDDIDPEKIVGKTASLRAETWDDERHWNGIVSRFTVAGRVMSASGDDMYAYECDIVPWLWLMTQNEDCRIFQNLSVPEIIETVLKEFAFDDYKLELSETHPKLEYCTQYRETTFAFLSRLMEREGIHYYFRHNEDDGEARHVLVMSDNRDGNHALDPEQIPFHAAGESTEYDAVTSLTRTGQMRTRKITLQDWDYQKKGVLSENTPTMLQIGASRDLERYRYPGGYVPPGGAGDAQVGKQLSRVMMEAEESSHMRLYGNGQVRSFAPGHAFTLYDHPVDSLNDEYLILSVSHRGRNNLFDEDQPADYDNSFSLQPHASVYRPPQDTPQALVRGPQTAIVVGPPGEELHVDELGRIMVRFHWDRKVSGRSTDMPDDKASCWVRVAQAWAGNGYGTMFIPRIGMEVVVEFLEGDPDRPLVTGCVYNGVNKPPYALPAEQTKSTIKTLSSKGGGGANELRFEDKKDNEEIFLHAQKDLQLRTGNCRTETVGVHSNLVVGKSLAETVGEHHTATVAENQTLSVGKNRQISIGTDDYRTIGANQHTDIGGNSSHTVGQNHDLNAGTNIAVTAGQNHDLNAGMNIAVAAGMNHDLDAGMNIAATAGMNMDLKAGINLVLDAGMIISLKAGGSSVVIGPAGVSITGAMVMINSGGAPPLSAKGAKKAKKAQKAEKADKPEKAKEAAKVVLGEVAKANQQAQAQALRNAATTAQPFCAECEAARKALRDLQGVA